MCGREKIEIKGISDKAETKTESTLCIQVEECLSGVGCHHLWLGAVWRGEQWIGGKLSYLYIMRSLDVEL